MSKYEIYYNAFSNTGMFVLGVTFGMITDILFDTIHETIDSTREMTRYIITVGLLQIFWNSLIILFMSTKFKNQMGMFSLGLLSAQTLVIKKVYELI